MKKTPYITAAGTVLLLYIFSLAPSVEEKITWGGIYPPPPTEFSWKEKWEISQKSLFAQDDINAYHHWVYLEDTVKERYKGNIKEPIIIFDKSPYKKILRYQRYALIEYVDETYVMSSGLDTYGETLDELIKKYVNDHMFLHKVDTFRYGYPSKWNTDPELGYMLSKIHYAEVHCIGWYVRKENDLKRWIYFINDNDTLRSFWGFQIGKGRHIEDNHYIVTDKKQASDVIYLL